MVREELARAPPVTACPPATAPYGVANTSGASAGGGVALAGAVAAAHRAQADAVEIEAQAKRRLADEYDAAQDRGEVAGPRDGSAGRSSGERPAPVADLGLTRKAIHEARQIRNAEAVSPGIVRRTLDQQLAQGKEPTKAAMRV